MDSRVRHLRSTRAGSSRPSPEAEAERAVAVELDRLMRRCAGWLQQPLAPHTKDALLYCLMTAQASRDRLRSLRERF